MDSHDIRRIVHEAIEGYLEPKDCPKCKENIVMVRFSLWLEEKEGEEGRAVERYRCMGCLSLFEEDLKEVK